MTDTPNTAETVLVPRSVLAPFARVVDQAHFKHLHPDQNLYVETHAEATVAKHLKARDFVAVRDALDAAPTAPAATGWRVRDLDWIKIPVTGMYRAETPVGVYTAWMVGSPAFWQFDNLYGQQRSGATDDLEAAKAAAQADFSTRVTACLERVQP